MNKEQIILDALDEVYDLTVTRTGLHPILGIVETELGTTIDYKGFDEFDNNGSIANLDKDKLLVMYDVVKHVAIQNQEYIDEVIGNFEDKFQGLLVE